jgi:hypothetical protein
MVIIKYVCVNSIMKKLEIVFYSIQINYKLPSIHSLRPSTLFNMMSTK